MSLSSEFDDLCAVEQKAEDNRDIYAYQLDNIPYFRQQPEQYAIGVYNNTINNGAAHVDLESLLRNQQMISSRCPEYRARADACLAPYMAAQAARPLTCSRVELVPEFTQTRRSCSTISGITIDRFDFLQFPQQGFKKGYAWQPRDTRQELWDQLEKNRAACPAYQHAGVEALPNGVSQ